MALLQIPGQFLAQPRFATNLDQSHWLFKNIVLAWSAGRGLNDGAHGMGSSVGVDTYADFPRGHYYVPGDDFSYLQFADNTDYNVLGELTIIAHIYAGGTTVQQAIVTKCETTGGANTPFGLFVEIGGNISLNRANIGGGTPFRVWSSAATMPLGQDTYLAVTQSGDISTSPKFYINGDYDSGAPTSLYGGSGTGAPTSNTTSVKIGNRTDLGSRCYHPIYDVIVANRVLSATEINMISNQFHTIWEAPTLDLWIPDTAPPSTTIPVFVNHFRNQGIM